MFKATIKAELLKGILQAVQCIGDNARFNVNDKGIYTRMADAGQVAMVILSLKKEAFESYEADSETFIVDITEIIYFLKIATVEDIALLEKKKDKLFISFGNITRKFGIVTDAEVSSPSIPLLAYKAKVGIPVKVLTVAMQASKSIADAVSLIADPEFFKMFADSGFGDDVTITLPKDLCVSHEVANEVQALYSLDYFGKVIQGIAKTEASEVLICFGNDYPVNMEVKIAEKQGEIGFIIAPRIEGD